MVLVSANVTPEQYEWKKKKNISWQYLIERGIDSIQNNGDISGLRSEFEELKKKQIRTAELLQHYASMKIANNIPLPQ